MDVFTFVIIIVAISCAAGVANNVLKNQRERQQLAGNGDVEDAGAQLDELRGRIEVLEKIVTDERYHLKREIDQLDRSA